MIPQTIDTFEKLVDHINQFGIDKDVESVKIIKKIFRQMDSETQIKRMDELAQLLTSKKMSDLAVPLRRALEKSNINMQLRIIQAKLNQLQIESDPKKGEKREVSAAKALHAAITKNVDEFFAENSQLSDDEFKKSCATIIEQHRPTLEKFGWKEILRNLTFAILGVGVIYVVAGLINKAMTGHFLFFRKDLAKQVDRLEQQINHVSPFQPEASKGC